MKQATENDKYCLLLKLYNTIIPSTAVWAEKQILDPSNDF